MTSSTQWTYSELTVGIVLFVSVVSLCLALALSMLTSPSLERPPAQGKWLRASRLSDPLAGYYN